MNNISNKHINDYLHFGYVPEFGKESLISHILNPPKGLTSLDNFTEQDLINDGITVLNQVFDDLLIQCKYSKHIVPLSGGLDSRLILAALLERISSDKIEAITFGSPGTFDFDLPDKVVQKAGINSKKVNCLLLDYSRENLINATKNGGRWTSVPDNFINRSSIENTENVGYWSGFMGGEIAGEYSTLGSDLDDNDEIFSQYQKRSKNLKLTEDNYNPLLSLKSVSQVPYNLTEFEMLFLSNRSAGGAIPIMYPKNKNIISPFLHPLWVNFIIRVPKKYREHAYLFQKIILKMYPELMQLGCKNKDGLGLHNKNLIIRNLNLIRLKYRYELTGFMNNINYPPLGANYLYYKAAFKTLPSLKKSIIESCNNLEDMEILPWLSPSKILEQHLSGKLDNSTPLLILLGLEVNIQVNKRYY